MSLPENVSIPATTFALDVEDLEIRKRRSFLIATCIVLVSTIAAAFVLVAIGSTGVFIDAASFGLVILTSATAAWLWKNPVRGIYVVFGAAVIMPAYADDSHPDIVGKYLPVFQDISTWTHFKGLSVSIAELFLVLLLLVWLLKALTRRELRYDRGSLMLPLSLYGLMVLVSELHGVTSGGDVTLSLWEVRGQAYMLLAYVLACNLIRTRRQMWTLVWVFMLGAGLRSIDGTFRYLFMHGTSQQAESLFPHEQAFFLNGFLTLALIFFLFGYGGSRRVKRVTLLLLPFVIEATIGNQRRAAILSFVVAIAVILLVTLLTRPVRRRTVGLIIFGIAVVFPPYFLTFQHSHSALAMPARALASSSSPNTRDKTSDLYRVNEDKDILATMKSSPVIGYGFGKPMLTPYKLADIKSIYAFWNILPHDSILWVWMRMGTIGFVILWLLIGTSILQGLVLLRRLRDPVLQGLALWIVTMVIQEVIFGYLDLQWSNYRNLIAIGVLFALISRLALFAGTGDDPAASNPVQLPRKKSSVRMSTPYQHAVVRGRLR